MFILLVPISKMFRLVEYEKHVHRHIMNPRTKDRKLTIQETHTRSTVPTNFNRRHNKENCTHTQPRTPPLTPVLTKYVIPISLLSEISPCSISLGLEDYGSLSPVEEILAAPTTVP